MNAKAIKARMTIKEFNAALLAEGIEIELVKGNGYLYFSTLDDSKFYDTRSEMVCYFKHLTPLQWYDRAVDYWNSIYKQHEAAKAGDSVVGFVKGE